jgi:hypothetical protein
VISRWSILASTVSCIVCPRALRLTCIACTNVVGLHDWIYFWMTAWLEECGILKQASGLRSSARLHVCLFWGNSPQGDSLTYSHHSRPHRSHTWVEASVCKRGLCQRWWLTAWWQDCKRICLTHRPITHRKTGSCRLDRTAAWNQDRLLRVRELVRGWERA